MEFDDVAWAGDAQALELSNGDLVSVRVNRGKVTVRLKQGRRRTRAA